MLGPGGPIKTPVEVALERIQIEDGLVGFAKRVLEFVLSDRLVDVVWEIHACKARRPCLQRHSHRLDGLFLLLLFDLGLLLQEWTLVVGAVRLVLLFLLLLPVESLLNLLSKLIVEELLQISAVLFSQEDLLLVHDALLDLPPAGQLPVVLAKPHVAEPAPVSKSVLQRVVEAAVGHEFAL